MGFVFVLLATATVGLALMTGNPFLVAAAVLGSLPVMFGYTAMTFTPGQPVAFIDATNLGLLGYGDEVYPTLNETYTVRDVVIDHFGSEGLLLHEIRNDRLPYRIGDKIVDFEKPFASWRFRPLVGGEKLKEMEVA